MKTLATLLIAAAAFAQTPAPAPAEPAKHGVARMAAIQKLQADLDQAVSRANLTEQQRSEMTTARETLRSQADHQRKGDKLDRGSVRQAMQTIRGLSASSAFQAEDREIMKKDLEEIRKNTKRGRSGSANGKRKQAA